MHDLAPAAIYGYPIFKRYKAVTVPTTPFVNLSCGIPYFSDVLSINF